MNVSDDNPLQLAVEIIAGRWRASIIYFLLNRSMRFSDLEKEIPKISQRMLILDLRKLQRAGIITRAIVGDRPIAVEYKLTEIGVELGSIVQALVTFGQRVPTIWALAMPNLASVSSIMSSCSSSLYPNSLGLSDCPKPMKSIAQ